MSEETAAEKRRRENAERKGKQNQRTALESNQEQLENQQAVETPSHQDSKPLSLQVNKSVSKQNSKPLTQQANKPANISKDLENRIKKTFYVQKDVANILKFIKFSVRKDESQFVNQALEKAVGELLGKDWREKFKEYLQTSP